MSDTTTPLSVEAVRAIGEVLQVYKRFIDDPTLDTTRDKKRAQQLRDQLHTDALAEDVERMHALALLDYTQTRRHP